ncbi:MAG: hypothetical protein H6718_07420 [Polyangiaceae bacterium]|nr:hypothetical protein [Myxococcales bacterium]MCB9585210.1 hypothetical protein [Polyangiaceae bacterium]
MKPGSFVAQPTSRQNRARPSAPPASEREVRDDESSRNQHADDAELSELHVEPLTSPGGEWLTPVCAWLSLALPLGLALLRASAGAQWRGDMSLVRSVGMVPIGLEGALSSVLAQLMSLVPIGGRHLRTALVSAIALGIAGRVIYAIARRLLAAHGFTPRLTPSLALAASLMTTLAVTWQLEGTIGGGATVAAALGLGTLLVRPSRRTTDLRIWFGFGGLVALATAESHVAGAAVAVALVVQALVVGAIPPRRALLGLGAGFALVALIWVIPMLVRPFSDRAGVQLGIDFTAHAVAGLDSEAVKQGALAAWLSDVGLVSLAIAAFGAAVGILRQSTRWLVAPMLTLVAADALLPAVDGSVLAPDPLMPLRLMAIGAVAVLTALGVHAAVLFLSTARIPLARPAATLMGLFTFALVLMTSERATHIADRRAQLGAEVWTDHALGRLPYGSVLLVRSPAVAWRLWAARVVRGERPDILVVPTGMLDKGSVARELLSREPTLSPLLRDVAVSGVPGEFALSSLADVRPLYVELDPRWDTRLVDHLVPEPMWLAFAPTALGRSDRGASLEKGREAFSEVLQIAKNPKGRDEATLAMLEVRAKEQVLALAALNDKQSVASLVDDLKQIDPTDPLVARLEKQLETHRRRRLDVSHILPE